MVRRVFVVLMVAVTWAAVQHRRQQPIVAVVVADAVDCNVHRAVHHHTVDTGLVRRQTVDFVVVLVGTVSPADTAAVVQVDIVVLLLDLIRKIGELFAIRCER